MLSKNSRVPISLFQEIVKHGRICHTAHFTLKTITIKNPNQSHASRFSFVVSKKTDPHAVGRNKLKRRSRAVIVKYIHKISPNNAGLFFIKPSAKQISFQDFEHEIVFLLKKTALLS